jgi:hypothetical protein
MVQVLPQKQMSPFGQILSGFGQGLSETLPKALEQRRLASHLKQFEQESPNLSPMQQQTRLMAIPGLSPLDRQTYADLARKTAKANAMKSVESKPNAAFPQIQNKMTQGEPSQIPSLASPESFELAQEGFIPPTQQQKLSEASQIFEENPAFFENDPGKAYDFVEKGYSDQEKIATAHQIRHANLTNLEKGVVDRLKIHSDKLAVQIPANEYSRIEDEAIQAVKPKKEGGKGLTEQQAIKEFGNKLDSVSRDYESINKIGNWAVIGRPTDETLRSIQSLQKKFKERNDLENFADSLISKSKLSPPYAYSLANPVSDYSSLSKTLSSMPNLKVVETFTETAKDPEIRGKTLRYSPELAKSLQEGASPLAIYRALEKKGYDGNEFLRYVDANRRNLNLKANQQRELDVPKSRSETLNDIWIQFWSGT